MAFAPHDEKDAHDSANNAAPPGIGAHLKFCSRNVKILGNLPIEDMGGGPANIVGNDCWGWNDSQTGREFALVGLVHGTSFVDITDPTNPLYIGFLPTQNGVSTWRDMKVYNDYLFVVADANQGHGMQVFDLANLRTADPQNPQQYDADVYYPDSGPAHNIVVNEDTGFAYIVGSDAAAGMHVVNIQNPLNPVFAGEFSIGGYTHDGLVVSYQGPDADYAGREIAFNCNPGGQDSLTIVDVTNKSSMSLVSQTTYPESGYAHQCWITDDHRYIYLGDEFDESQQDSNTRILVFDCLDLDNPQFLGFYLGETVSVDHNLFVRGDKIFQANYTSGMRVLQIDPNDPVNLSEVGFVDTYPLNDFRSYNGAWACWPFFKSGNIIINDRQHGLFIVRLMEVEFEFPEGRPDIISAEGGTEFIVRAIPGIQGAPQPETGFLHIDQGNGFKSFPLSQISDNLYEAIFPEMECNSEIRYYVSVTSQNGIVETSPPLAPADFYTARTASNYELPFADNFETDTGWIVSGDAIAGQWERGVPVSDGDFGSPKEDADGSGSAYLTMNAPGESDVDGGITILTSPIMDAIADSSAEAAILRYYRWYTQYGTVDTMLVEISNDAGANWTTLETVGPFGEISQRWIEVAVDIDEYLPRTNAMQVRFTVGDLEDDSYIEAGVDGVQIELIYCDADVLLGDVNLDGVVNLLDVAPFIELLSTGDYQAEADMNSDGSVNLLDVGLFVDALGT